MLRDVRLAHRAQVHAAVRGGVVAGRLLEGQEGDDDRHGGCTAARMPPCASPVLQERVALLASADRRRLDRFSQRL